MGDGWWYSKNGQQFGPVALSELARLVEEGNVGPRELCWNERVDEWVLVGSVEELALASTKSLMTHWIAKPVIEDAARCAIGSCHAAETLRL